MQRCQLLQGGTALSTSRCAAPPTRGFSERSVIALESGAAISTPVLRGAGSDAPALLGYDQNAARTVFPLSQKRESQVDVNVNVK